MLEESPLVLLLVDSNLCVYVARNSLGDGTAVDLLQPLITVVLFPEFVIFALKRRSVNPFDAARMAPTPAQKIWMFSAPLEQVRQGATLRRIQMHHPPQGTSR